MAARTSGRLDGRPRKFYRSLVEELIAFAEHEFWLAQPLGDDGASRREHFASAARQGIRSPYMAGPELPEVLRYVWGWFLDIHAGRTQTGMGHSKATHLDLMAWQSNKRISLEQWECDVIQALGSAWLTETSLKKAELPPALRNR